MSYKVDWHNDYSHQVSSRWVGAAKCDPLAQEQRLARRTCAASASRQVSEWPLAVRLRAFAFAMSMSMSASASASASASTATRPKVQSCPPDSLFSKLQSPVLVPSALVVFGQSLFGQCTQRRRRRRRRRRGAGRRAQRRRRSDRSVGRSIGAKWSPRAQVSAHRNERAHLSD